MNINNTKLDNKYHKNVFNEYLKEHIATIDQCILQNNESGQNFVEYELPDVFISLDIKLSKRDIQAILYGNLILHYEEKRFKVYILKVRQKKGHPIYKLKLEWEPLYEKEEINKMEKLVLDHTQEV